MKKKPGKSGYSFWNMVMSQLPSNAPISFPVKTYQLPLHRTASCSMKINIALSLQRLLNFSYSFCFSATASLSASGSFARITELPTAFAVLIDKSWNAGIPSMKKYIKKQKILSTYERTLPFLGIRKLHSWKLRVGLNLKESDIV